MPVEAMITTSEALTASAVRILGCSVAISMPTSATAWTPTNRTEGCRPWASRPRVDGLEKSLDGRSVDSVDQCGDSEGYGEK
jgi:hypothetical protein